MTEDEAFLRLLVERRVSPGSTEAQEMRTAWNAAILFERNRNTDYDTAEASAEITAEMQRLARQGHAIGRPEATAMFTAGGAFIARSAQTSVRHPPTQNVHIPMTAVREIWNHDWDNAPLDGTTIRIRPRNDPDGLIRRAHYVPAFGNEYWLMHDSRIRFTRQEMRDSFVWRSLDHETTPVAAERCTTPLDYPVTPEPPREPEPFTPKTVRRRILD